MNTWSDNLTDLLKVRDALSDYLMALEIPEFAEVYGGIDHFLEILKAAYEEYETVHNYFKDDEV